MINKLSEPEKLADEITERIIDTIGRPAPVQKIRNSQVLSAIIGAAGLALFLVGVEKVFSFLSGSVSILFGIVLMAVSGVLLTKLK